MKIRNVSYVSLGHKVDILCNYKIHPVHICISTVSYSYGGRIPANRPPIPHRGHTCISLQYKKTSYPSAYN